MEYGRKQFLNFYETYKTEITMEEYNRQKKERNGMFCTFEWFALYTTIRGVGPTRIFELGPGLGFTTYAILKALRKNEKVCEINTFDISKEAKRRNEDLTKGFAKSGFVRTFDGDVKKNFQKYNIEKYDFVFIDADHSYEFGKWYCENILRKVREGVLIWVHDWEGYDHNEVEMLAVKDYAIKNGLVKPIINLMDFVKKNRVKEFTQTPETIAFAKGDRSPSQVLRKLQEE